MISRPYGVHDGVQIKLDKNTGQYINVPTSMLDAVGRLGTGSTVTDSSIDPSLLPACPRQRRHSSDVYYSFSSHVTVHIDRNSELGFRGLPVEWEVMLKKNGFLKEEVMRNPKEVLDVIHFLRDPTRAGELPVALSRSSTIQPSSSQPIFSPHSSQPNTENLEQSPADHSQIPIPQKTHLNSQKNPRQRRHHQKQKIILSDPTPLLTNLRRIDSGSTLTIYSAFYTELNKEVNVKQMKLTPKNEESLLKETELLINLTPLCKNIVTYFASYKMENTLWIISDIMDGGTLTNIAIYCTITESQIAYFAREVLIALDSLHSQKKIHRDINTDNILLRKNGEVYLADIGFPSPIADQLTARRSVVGTPYWMAPELIKLQPFTEAVDIWSVGVLCLELAENDQPYVQFPSMKAMYIIMQQGMPEISAKETRSAQFLDFLQLSLNVDPNLRPPAKKLLEHPFIKMACAKDEIPPLIQFAQEKQNEEQFIDF